MSLKIEERKEMFYVLQNTSFLFSIFYFVFTVIMSFRSNETVQGRH